MHKKILQRYSCCQEYLCGKYFFKKKVEGCQGNRRTWGRTKRKKEEEEEEEEKAEDLQNVLQKKVEAWPHQASLYAKKSPMGTFSRATKLGPRERRRGKMKWKKKEKKKEAE